MIKNQIGGSRQYLLYILISIFLLMGITACDLFEDEEIIITHDIVITVISENEEAIAGAHVVIDDRNKLTDENGTVIFENIRGSDDYTVEVVATGYSDFVVISLNVPVDFPYIVTMTADPGINEEMVTVSGMITVEHSFPQSVVALDKGNESLMMAQPVTAGQRKLSAADFEQPYRPGELIIRFASGVSPEERKQLVADRGYEIIDTSEVLNSVLVRIPEITMQSSINQLSQHSKIESVDYNYRVFAQNTIVLPNDKEYDKQWNFPLIRLPQAWGVTIGSPTIRVAVIDSGLAVDHPDFGSQVDWENAYNFLDDSDDVDDDNGHGTHVAGIIGATTNNGEGIAGVLWQCELLPLKVLDNEGPIWALEKAILYAAGLLDEPHNPKPVDIINLSLGFGKNSDILKEVINKAHDVGVLIVAASGNHEDNNNKAIMYPAAYDNVIAVGAVEYNNSAPPLIAYYSNYGNDLDLVAPGTGIYSTVPSKKDWDGFYTYKTGTSMAAPHVAGVIGLMLANYILPKDVQGILRRTGMVLWENNDGDQEFHPEYGYGLVNAYWAVNNVQDIRVFIEKQSGDTLEIVAETTVPLKGGSYTFNNILPGSCRVMAEINVQSSETLGAGDYFGESDLLELVAGEEYSVDLTVREQGTDL